MNLPLEITYRNVVKSDYIDNIIRVNSIKLDKICDYITSCRVAIEKPQAHQRGGRPYRVRIDITVPPGHEIVVKKDQTKGDSSTQLSTIIKKAFEAAYRQLRSLKERQRGEVKIHPALE